jgi:hypothetical protein
LIECARFQLSDVKRLSQLTIMSYKRLNEFYELD